MCSNCWDTGMERATSTAKTSVSRDGCVDISLQHHRRFGGGRDNDEVKVCEGIGDNIAVMEVLHSLLVIQKRPMLPTTNQCRGQPAHLA